MQTIGKAIKNLFVGLKIPIIQYTKAWINKTIAKSAKMQKKTNRTIFRLSSFNFIF